MAKIVGVGTGIKGKVGNLKYRTVKGVQIVQSMSIPHNPRTSKQLSNRSVFSQLNTLFKPLSGSLIKSFWNPFVIGKRSGWSVCLSENLKLQTVSPIVLLNIITSIGSLPGSTITVAQYKASTGEINIIWDLFHPSGSSPLDFAIVYIYDSLHLKWYSSSGTQIRSSRLISEFIFQGLDFDDLYCHLFFFSGDLSKNKILSVSNDVCEIMTKLK